MTIRLREGAGILFSSPSPERDAATDRIIKATGLKPDDRDRLAAGIEMAILELSLHEHMASQRNKRKQGKGKDRAKKYLSKLQKLAREFPTIQAAIGRTIDQAVAELDRDALRVDIKIPWSRLG
jgi:hypothetical protein